MKISVCYGQTLSAAECKELGYVSNSLLCSSCVNLKEFKLTELEKTCKQCCILDGDGENEPVKKVTKFIFGSEYQFID